MSKYTHHKNGISYPDFDSLVPVKRIVREAADGIADRKRTIKTSSIRNVLTRIAQSDNTDEVDAPVVSSASMIKDVAAAPVAAFAIAGLGILNHRKSKQLDQEKQRLYEQAIRELRQVNKQSDEEADKDPIDEQRLVYLESIGEALRQIMTSLEIDMELFKHEEF
ncbi:MAG: hypothetical protein ACOYB8_06425 [Eubacteriaceae bacterium]|jgi:hypothetical protein